MKNSLDERVEECVLRWYAHGVRMDEARGVKRIRLWHNELTGAGITWKNEV